MHPSSRTTLLLTSVFLFSMGALPDALQAGQAPQPDHAHAAATAGAKADPSTAANAMQQMQAMHEKMMAAKTPAERQTLMADHMKAMQEGMNTMQRMNAQSGDNATSSAMQTRMNMMTMMMQMMMDRQQMGGMPMSGMPMSGMPMGTTPSTPPAVSPAK